MDEEALQWTRGEVWARAFPDAPPGELERFRVANIDKPLEAKRIYDWYRGWRRAEGSAARVAASAARVPNFHFVTVGGRTPLGDKILLVEGARFDPSVDPAAYVALICLRMDEAFRANDDGKVVVLIDCRGGARWPNPPARKIVPLLRRIASVVPNVYPERLRNILVYPLVPWIGRLARGSMRMLDRVTRDKVVLMDGLEGHYAPAPEALRDHVTHDLVPPHAADRHAVLRGGAPCIDIVVAEGPVAPTEAECAPPPPELDDRSPRKRPSRSASSSSPVAAMAKAASSLARRKSWHPRRWTGRSRSKDGAADPADALDDEPFRPTEPLRPRPEAGRSPPRKKESRRTVAWHDDDDYLVALSRVDSPPESPDLDQKEEPPAPTLTSVFAGFVEALNAALAADDRDRVDTEVLDDDERWREAVLATPPNAPLPPPPPRETTPDTPRR